MTRADIKKRLIEFAVERAIREARDDSRLSVRKIVDLGCNFARGDFQQRLFRRAQTMLADEKSEYFELARRLCLQVDERTLKCFGMNVVYMSWTVGAKKICQIEKTEGVRLPWLIGASINRHFDAQDMSQVVTQGRDCGIYSYWVRVDDAENLTDMLEVAALYPDCAFALFTHCDACTSENIERAQEINNILISIDGGEDALRNMTEAHLLCAQHYEYDDVSGENLATSGWLEELCDERCAAAFLLPGRSCDCATVQKIGDWVESVRKGQKYPLSLMDLLADAILFGRKFGADAGTAWINSDGTLSMYNSCWSDGALDVRGGLMRAFRALSFA